jgi:iron complex outermembrane receptor protein
MDPMVTVPNRGKTVWLAGLLSTAWCLPAWAQQSPTTSDAPGKRAPTQATSSSSSSSSPSSASSSASPASASGTKLEVVTVTAQRRTQRLQDVPVAVTVFSGKELAQKQTVDTSELIRLVPNMSGGENVGQGSANVYYIRGLGQTQSFTTFEPQVGTYVNDIYISRQNANNFALFDVQDIQVLRGPQGTLFGRNSTGGAIVVTLDPPRDSYGGTLELGGGGRDRFTGRASVDLPINSQILTKTSVFGITDNGFVHDLTTGQRLNDKHDVGVREAVRLISKSGSLVWDLSADYADDQQANVYNFPGANGDRVSYSGFRTDGSLMGYLDGDLANQGQGSDVKSWGFASDLKLALDAGTLHVISGFRGLKQNSAIDFPDSQFGPLVPDDQGRTGQFALAFNPIGDEYTQEVKWNGTLGRLTYTTGAYGLYETDQTTYGAVAYLPAVVPFPIPLGDEGFRNTTSSVAVYGQADYKVLDGLLATVGLRYTLERKRLQITGNGPGGFDTADLLAAGYKDALNSDVLTPRFALQYRIDPTLMVYASATRGFQGGGWNSLAFSANTFNNFGPEKVWSYESGVRYAAPGGGFRASANVFLQEVSNYQLLATSPSPGNFTTNNAANLENYGLELEASWIPIRNLTLSGNVGIETGSYNSPSALVKAQQLGCFSGRATANAGLIAANCGSGIVQSDGRLAGPSYLPPVTAALSATYVQNFRRFSLTPTVGVQMAARQNDDPAGNPGGVVPAYATVDAGVTFHLDKAPWTFTAECRNCSMTDYGVSYLFGYKYYNDPGIWDVRLNYKF